MFIAHPETVNSSSVSKEKNEGLLEWSQVVRR